MHEGPPYLLPGIDLSSLAEMHNTTGLSELIFAATVTVACTGYTMRFLSQQQHNAGKDLNGQQYEQTFMVNALGMVQGWAWSDCVDGNFLELMKTVPIGAYKGTLWATVLPNFLCLVLTLLLTVFVFGLRGWLANRFREVARTNWRRGRVRLKFMNAPGLLKGSQTACAAATSMV